MTVSNGGDRDPRGRFRAGNGYGRGNPGLRRLAGLQGAVRGAVTPGELRNVLRTLLAMAKAGDVQAARCLLDRVAGPAQAMPISDPLPLDLAGDDLSQLAREITAARARGDLSDAQAHAAMALVESRVRIDTFSALAARVAALEGTA